MAVTIYDVAKRAGVSPATVSIVYNGSKYCKNISEATRARVEAVIREMGFQANVGARGISTQRFESIGVGVNLPRGRSAPFHLEMINGIETVCSEREYLCIMSRVQVSKTEMPKILRARCIDGYLAVQTLSPEAYARIKPANLPVLLVNATNWCDCPAVNWDDRHAMNLALDTLWSKGHRRIGFVCVADMVHYSRTERMDSYLQWTRDHGCPANIMEEAERALLNFPRWIQEQLAKPEPITAVICYDYIMGARALRALEAMKVKVPDQLSVAAFSIPPLASIEYSVLGGIEYDTYEMGQIAATEMIDALVQNRPPQSHILRGTWQDNSTVRAL